MYSSKRRAMVASFEDTVSCTDSPTTFGPYALLDDAVTTEQRLHCFPFDAPTSVRITASGPPGSELVFYRADSTCLTSTPLTEETAVKRIELGTTAEFVFGDCTWVGRVRSEPETVGDVSITLVAVE